MGEETTGNAEEQNRRLRAALVYALDVIESYEMDLRNTTISGNDLALLTLAEQGFCQGRMYTNARNIVRRIASGETTV